MLNSMWVSSSVYKRSSEASKRDCALTVYRKVWNDVLLQGLAYLDVPQNLTCSLPIPHRSDRAEPNFEDFEVVVPANNAT